MPINRQFKRSIQYSIKRVSSVLGLLLIFSMSSLQADWSIGVEGGTVIRDDETASRIRLQASLDNRPLSHFLYADWIRSDSSSFEFGYKPRYWFTNTLYAFSDASLRIDNTLLIDRQSLLLGGVGLQPVSNSKQQIWIETGVGYRVIDYSDDTLLEDDEETVGVIRGSASQVFAELFKIQLNGDAYTSESFSQSTLEAGLSMRVPQGAIKISHRIRRLSIDDEDTIDDSDTSVGFTVGF